MLISVIICAHNPRADYLRRTLEGLRGQSLAPQHWELILVDNRSSPPVADMADMGWHPNARIVIEEELGLTPARLRGFAESRADLILMVDDDNELAADYLELGLAIRQSMPCIEVLGGSITGEFAEAPQPWMKPYLSMLAIRDVNHDVWSNDPHRLGLYPCGAGMFLTKRVAAAYADIVKRDPRRRGLDRRGSALTSGGDCDICFTAGSLHLGVGLFPKLRLTHLIAEDRLSLPYLLRLCEGITASGIVLSYLWGRAVDPPKNGFRRRLGLLRQRWQMSPIEREFSEARLRAEVAAAETIRQINAEPAN
jgi:glycosyltransferase involved in cell wall biosynthesis